MSVVKNGLPVPAAKITTLPFSRCLTARRRMYGSATSDIRKAVCTLVGTPRLSIVACRNIAFITVASILQCKRVPIVLVWYILIMYSTVLISTANILNFSKHQKMTVKKFYTQYNQQRSDQGHYNRPRKPHEIYYLLLLQLPPDVFN